MLEQLPAETRECMPYDVRALLWTESDNDTTDEPREDRHLTNSELSAAIGHHVPEPRGNVLRVGIDGLGAVAGFWVP